MTRGLLWLSGLLVIIAVLGAALVAWRVHDAPLALPDWAHAKLESRLRSPGGTLEIDGAALYWPEVSGPLYVQATGVALTLPGGAAYPDPGHALTVPKIALSLDIGALLTGRVRARALLIEGAEIALAPGASPPAAPALPILPRGPVLAGAVRLALTQLPPELRDLELVDIRGVQVRRAGWAAPPLDIRLARGAGGLLAAEVTFHAQGEGGPGGAGTLLFDTRSGDITLTARARALRPLEALARAGVALPTLAAPLPPLNAHMKAQYTSETDSLTLETLEVTDGAATATARATLTYAPAAGWRGPVVVGLDALEADRLDALWPEDLRYGAAHEWLVEKIENGTFRNIEARATVALNGDLPEISNATARFGFEGLAVDYRPPLAPARGLSGRGALDAQAQTLALTLEGGGVGGLALAPGGTVTIDHLMTAGVGRARVEAGISGPVPALMAYLAPEPINAARYLDLEGADAGAMAGQARADVRLDMPTQPGAQVADIEVAATGRLTGAAIPGVVGGLALTGADVDVTLQDWLLTLRGSARLGDAPVPALTAEFALQPGAAPFARRIRATLTATPALRDALRIPLAPYVTGPMEVEVLHTLAPDGRAHAGVTADLTGAAVDLSPLDYTKAPGVAATARLEADWAPGEVLERVTMEEATGPGLAVRGVQARFAPGGAVASVAARDVQLGESRGSVAYTAPADGGPARLSVEAAVLDLAALGLRGAPDGPGAKPLEPLEVKASIQTLFVADGHAIGPVSLVARTGAGGLLARGELHANTRPGTLDATYGPGPDSSAATFKLRATDLGAALDGLGASARVEGGSARIDGLADAAGVVRGTVDLRGFTVYRAPILARLLAALSLDGALAALSGGAGLPFTRLEAGFAWAPGARLGAGVLTLADGRTSGSALGLTFAGTVDMAARTLDLSGTIVPLSQVSRVAGGVPVIGRFLTGGGTGAGVFAATYAVRGPLDALQVSVNPLAALAPGILRTIMFE